jgi:hypothetical protein
MIIKCDAQQIIHNNNNSRRKKYHFRPNNNRSIVSLQNVIWFIVSTLTGFYFTIFLRTCIQTTCQQNRIMAANRLKFDSPGGLFENKQVIFTNISNDENLVFIGIMTAQKFLKTRAKSVYETWGRDIPGKISFFSRTGSSTNINLPLVSLPGVDDSYPPQVIHHFIFII